MSAELHGDGRHIPNHAFQTGVGKNIQPVRHDPVRAISISDRGQESSHRRIPKAELPRGQTEKPLPEMDSTRAAEFQRTIRHFDETTLLDPTPPIDGQFSHPELKASEEKSRIHRLELSNDIFTDLDKGQYESLLKQIRDKLIQLGLQEDDLVFRGLSHPAGNITAQLLDKYGTDRFVGFGTRNLPVEDKNLTPYRNNGETEWLTADTYVTTELKGALTCTDVGLYGITMKSISFRTGETESFLVLYDRSSVEINNIPNKNEYVPTPDQDELWRTTFLTDPRIALRGVIKLTPSEEIPQDTTLQTGKELKPQPKKDPFKDARETLSMVLAAVDPDSPEMLAIRDRIYFERARAEGTIISASTTVVGGVRFNDLRAYLPDDFDYPEQDRDDELKELLSFVESRHRGISVKDNDEASRYYKTLLTKAYHLFGNYRASAPTKLSRSLSIYYSQIAKIQALAEKEKIIAAANAIEADLDQLVNSRQSNQSSERQLPEGMIIALNQEVEEAGWEDLGFQVTKKFRLDAELNGTNYGHIRAEKRIKKTWDTANKERDRYVYLSHIFVETKREHGIGSSLLAEMEKNAREFGASRIEGKVYKSDIDKTPGLLDFYRRRGYEVTLVDPDKETYRIEKILQARN